MIHLTLDQANASLELAGAILRTLDCYRLYRAKRFVGGSIFTALFFFGWGAFNTVYYPSLHQTYSFVAAIALTLVNGIWIVMALYYNRKYQQGQAA
jgi:hypothetical protein